MPKREKKKLLYKHWRVTRSTAAAPPLNNDAAQNETQVLQREFEPCPFVEEKETGGQPSVRETTQSPLDVLTANPCSCLHEVPAAGSTTKQNDGNTSNINQSGSDVSTRASSRSAGGGGQGGWFKGRLAGLLPLARLVNNHQSQEPSTYLMALCSAQLARSLQIISVHIIGPYLI